MNDFMPQQGIETDINRQELLMALRYDCVALFAFYLGEELTLAVPDFHVEIWDELLEMIQQVNLAKTVLHLKKLFAVPRGHAKSTLAKLAVILFLMYTPLKFVLYASKTVGHGKNAIRDILIWLQSPQQVALHGQYGTIKANEGEAVWIIDLPIRDPITMEVTIKRCIFKALGADTHVRGTLILNQRPQIVIVDDIEDTDNTTPDLQPKLDVWFMGSFWKSFDASRHVVIFIGNMIRKTTLLARFTKDPEWLPTVFGAIVRDKETKQIRSLWEDKFPLQILLKEYRAFRKLGTGHVWEAEMMNLTQDEIFQSTMEKAIRPPHPNPEDLEAGCLILDPTFGQSVFTDDTAITVHGRIKGLGIPVLIDVFTAKITEEAMFDKMLELSYYWGISTWIIESDVAQSLVIPYFKLLVRDRMLNQTAFTMLPIHTNRIAKPARIMTFRNAISDGSYGVSESLDDFLDTLTAFVPGGQRHDDALDSAAHGVSAWTTYDPVITANGIQIQLFKIAANQYGESGGYVPETEVSSF